MSYANNVGEKSHSTGAVILNDSEESHSADKEILPPYSRQNDNAGKKKAASKRGPVILSEAKNLKNRFCQLLPWTPQSLRTANCSPVLGELRKAVRGINRGAIQVQYPQFPTFHFHLSVFNFHL